MLATSPDYCILKVQLSSSGLAGVLDNQNGSWSIHTPDIERLAALSEGLGGAMEPVWIYIRKDDWDGNRRAYEVSWLSPNGKHDIERNIDLRLVRRRGETSTQARAGDGEGAGAQATIIVIDRKGRASWTTLNGHGPTRATTRTANTRSTLNGASPCRRCTPRSTRRDGRRRRVRSRLRYHRDHHRG